LTPQQSISNQSLRRRALRGAEDGEIDRYKQLRITCCLYLSISSSSGTAGLRPAMAKRLLCSLRSWRSLREIPSVSIRMM
jgi:hypothetical protein